MKYIIALLLIPLMFGCSSVEEKTPSLELTFTDIVEALDLNKWLVKIPHDLKHNQEVVLKVTYDEREQIVAHISSNPGKIAKVMLWREAGQDYWLASNEETIESSRLHISGLTIRSMSRENLDHICEVGEVLVSGTGDTWDGPTKKSIPYRLYAAVEEKSIEQIK